MITLLYLQKKLKFHIPRRFLYHFDGCFYTIGGIQVRQQSPCGSAVLLCSDDEEANPPSPKAN